MGWIYIAHLKKTRLSHHPQNRRKSEWRIRRDIGWSDPGTPMDFHAYCEIYLGQEWLTFDPRHNVPRIGRVKVAHVADAVNGAFATISGEAKLTYFQVWAYQVNPPGGFRRRPD